MCRTKLAILLLLLTGVASHADKLGDPAAALHIANWVKGEPIDLGALKGKKTVVVEFWATWCPPCLTSIPHLTELQKKYKDDLVIIGVTKEEFDVVEPFVKEMGDKMVYTVAMDDTGQTNKAYMAAYNKDGYPHAFIVDKAGRVAFDAHPAAPEFEEALKAIVADAFDLESVVAKREREAELEIQLSEYFELAMKGRKRKAGLIGEELLKGFSESADQLNQLAWIIATAEDLNYRDNALALRAAQKACTLTENKDALILNTCARVLFNLGRIRDAITYQEKAVALLGSRAMREQLQKTLELYQTLI